MYIYNQFIFNVKLGLIFGDVIFDFFNDISPTVVFIGSYFLIKDLKVPLVTKIIISILLISISFYLIKMIKVTSIFFLIGPFFLAVLFIKVLIGIKNNIKINLF